MDLKWLEDFLNLVETKSFSASARNRNVTQSAFSRRIRSLELWLGADLLDRSTYPIRLTNDGRAFRESAEEIVRLIYQGRAGLGGRSAAERPAASIAITALHSLTLTFLPRWLTGVRGQVGEIATARAARTGVGPTDPSAIRQPVTLAPSRTSDTAAQT